ncbi:MAG: Ppx/GppA family phosphatase [Holophagaceae bacterium]|nr:Ppx/GppA family phosphatase [Holophagaceae bacterium]
MRINEDRKKTPSFQFPLKLAGIDVGSNAIRFLIAEFDSIGNYHKINSGREPVRLGHDVFVTGRMRESAIASAIEAIKKFKLCCEQQDVHALRIVATSAVREADNSEVFCEQLKSETGLDVEIISGGEEARLVHTAIKNKVLMGRSRWISVDVGGGSVEISLVDSEGILLSESHPIGTVRLLEEFAEIGSGDGRFKRLITEYIANLKLPGTAQRYKPAGIIATGGNIEVLAKITNSKNNDGMGTISLTSLRSAIETIGGLSYKQRMEQLGLKPDRADVILPAAMVYEKISSLSGVDEILVPFVGIRDGIIIDLFDTIAFPENSIIRQANQLNSSCLTLGRKFFFDEPHALQVQFLSLSIFDQIQEYIGLDSTHRHILSAASLLHDIGYFISDKRHHKHSYYIVINSEILGLDYKDLQLVASIIRFHRKSEPSVRNSEFTALSEEDQFKMVRFAGILRLADSLDTEHIQRVKTLKIEDVGDKLKLNIEASGDLMLEKWSFTKKSQMLSKIIEKPIVIG